MVGVCSGTDIMTTDRVGARSRADGMDGGWFGALSGTDVVDRGRGGALSRADGMDEDMGGALCSTIITARGRFGALSGTDGVDRGQGRCAQLDDWHSKLNEEHGKQSGWARQGHDGGAQREICGAQQSGWARQA